MTPADNAERQYESCFISYSHKDEEFARTLHTRLRESGLRVWYAPEEMKGGQKIHEQIERAIQRYDRLLLVLSESSMNSEWVKTEIYNARQREIKEGRRILFPVALVPFGAIREWRNFDADTGKDMAREIREYYIPDFSHWQDHDPFEREFSKLLRDLQTVGRRMSAAENLMLREAGLVGHLARLIDLSAEQLQLWLIRSEGLEGFLAAVETYAPAPSESQKRLLTRLKSSSLAGELFARERSELMRRRPNDS